MATIISLRSISHTAHRRLLGSCLYIPTKRKIALRLSLVFLGAVLFFHSTQTAKACGLKLTVSGVRGKSGVTPSVRPSRILIVGHAPSNLERSLTKGGHYVEKADGPTNANGESYSVVLVENDTEVDRAKAAWPQAHIMKMVSNAERNIREVELAVSRTTLDRNVEDANRTVIAANETRPPIAAGPAPAQELVAAAPQAATSARATEPVRMGHEPPAEATTNPATSEDSAAQVSAETPNKVIAVADKSKRESPEARNSASQNLSSTVALGSRRSDRVDVIFFAMNSTEFTPAASQKLSLTVSQLTRRSGRFAVEGHANSGGNSQHNMILSQQRADAVRRRLIEAGVQEDIIDTKGLGETEPVFGNGSSAKNRCVVIRYISSEVE